MYCLICFSFLQIIICSLPTAGESVLLHVGQQLEAAPKNMKDADCSLVGGQCKSP